MSLIKLQGRLYIVQRGAVCGLFLLWGCLLLFPMAEALLFAVFGMVLAAAGIIDLESRRVSGFLCLLLAVVGGVKLCLLTPNPAHHLLEAAVISALLLLSKFLLRTGLGGGDVKLLAASSLFLDWTSLLRGIFIGCLLALCAGILAWMVHKKIYNCEMAFVPFLTIGILGAVFCSGF